MISHSISWLSLAVPMKAGKQAVTVTAKNGVKTTFDVTVEKHAATFVTPSPAILGC